MNTAQREHESLEEKLRALMALDEKARAKHDKLVGELQTASEEIAQIAAGKLEIMGQLGGLYKRHAGGKK